MSNFITRYRTAETVTISLDGLANGATAISNVLDNTSNKDQEIELELKIEGTSSGFAYLDVRVLRSIDGGITYETQLNALCLPVFLFSTASQVYHARFQAPAKYKICVFNATGNVLGSSCYAKVMGISYQTS
jgi:hypothetical protein